MSAAAEFKEGQEVYIVGVNRREAMKTTVVKVGRKLVHVDEGHGHWGAYRIDTGARNDRFGHDRVLTVDQYAEQMRRRDLLVRLRDGGLGERMGRSLPIDVLARVVAALESE